jgi:EAL domain-containing protein (putative c-di-GMP-specific phosphodiesterase class I)
MHRSMWLRCLSSSLSYPRLFPFDEIKIDQSFIRELWPSKDCGAIVKAAVDVGASLGITPAAEGVETSEQLAASGSKVAAKSRDISSGSPNPSAR